MILHHLIFTTVFIRGQAQFWDYENDLDYGLNQDDIP